MVSEMSTIKLFGITNRVLLNNQKVRGNLTTLRCMASDWVPKEKETHTGQRWEADDYRLVRFIDKTKHVNENFAIDLIAEAQPKACKEHVTWCDGGGGPTGHPKVYINLDKPGNHSCGYCGLRFFYDSKHDH